MEIDVAVIRRCISSILKQFDYEKKELSGKPLKKLTITIRKTDGIFCAFVDVLFEYLRKSDCDLRLGILLITNYFFQRSHNFRLELINHMQDFLVYTLETDPLHYPLPKPPAAADLLKKEMMKILRLWIEKFGPGYQKLQRLEYFLTNSKSLDWDTSQAKLLIDRQREEDERFQKELRARKIVGHISKLYDDNRMEIERIRLEAKSIIDILFPRFCSLEHQSVTNAEDQHANNINYAPNIIERLHGLQGNAKGIEICLNENKMPIEIKSDNVDIINQLKDTTKLLDKWDSKVGNWLNKLTQIGDLSNLIRFIIDMRRDLNEQLQKCNELMNLSGQRCKADDDASDSDDSDFLDVPEKEGYEPEFCFPENSQPQSNNNNHLDEQPGPSGLNCQKIALAKTFDEKNATSLPTLTMGLDLRYWGEKTIKPAERVRNQADEDNYWRPTENADDGCFPTENMEAYLMRQITYVNEMPPLEKMCRAPLPSGKLCPRMERHSCAIHGKIIDRDEQGYPLVEQQSESATALKQLEERKQLENREYLRDIEAATGVILTSPEKVANNSNKTARSRLKPENVKTRERLKTKLFDKRSLKRVSATLDQIQKARAERNFSHQFNYALSSRRII